MSSVSLDMGSIDIYFNNLVPEIVSDCTEEDLLRDLADAEEEFGKNCVESKEKEFCSEAAKKLRELADWFKINHP